MRFVATENGTTILDVPTNIRVGPNGLCGYDGPPPLSFDGHYAAWPTVHGLHVVDVTTGQESDYATGVFFAGSVALLPDDGLRTNVTLLDLSTGVTRVVEAPAGQSFIANFPGAVVARELPTATGQQQAEPRISVLDPVSGTWLIDGQVVPGGGATAHAGSHDWIVFGDETQAAVLEVRTGAVTVLATHGRPYGIDGDRLYLTGPASQTSTGAWASMVTWSVALPGGGDRMEGGLPQHHVVGNRTVAFVAQGTGTQSSTTTNPGSSSDPGFTPNRTTASTTAPDGDGDGDGVIALTPPLAWAALVALAVAAWATRRRM